MNARITSIVLAMFLSGGAAAQTAERFVPDELLVRFKPGTETSAARAIDDLRATVLGELRQIGVTHLKLVAGFPLDVALGWLSVQPFVDFVEPNYVAEAVHVPNDPGYPNQWGPPKIACESAWDVNQGSPSTVLAIVDTGVDKNHSDLSAKLLAGFDFINVDADPDDDNGHGTHCAGIAAAITNNGVGVAGVGYGCSIMPVKVLNSGGSGSYQQVADGIVWAADHGAHVISMSLGGTSPSSTLESAVNYAWNAGVLIVAAAGNSGSTSPLYPAYYANCIAVASTNSSDQRSGFSNYGSWVDVAAPGEAIYSTYDGNSYATLSGTSMATPHVAGEAGLLWSHLGTGVGNATIRARIEDNCDSVGSFVIHGRINCYLALTAGGGGGETRTDFAPASYTILTGSRTAGDVTSLGASDNLRLEIAGAKIGRDYVCDWYGTTSATFSGTLTGLEITLESNYTNPRSCTVYLWNWNSLAWDSLGSVSLPTSDTTSVFAAAIPGNYVSGSGEIRARCYGTRKSKSITQRTDQLKFTTVTQ